MKIKESFTKIWKKFFPKEKVVILIDGENLWYSLVELGGLQISDFEEFKKRLVNLAEGKGLARPPIYFRSVDIEKPKYPEETIKTLRFLAHLGGLGYEIIKRPLLKEKEPKSEIDPVIAVEICRSAIDKKISTIVLLSGDRHFAPAVEFAKERGKKVKVVSTEASLSAELKKESDQWINLEKLIKGITQKSEMEEKRKEALKKLREGKKITLSDFKEIP